MPQIRTAYENVNRIKYYRSGSRIASSALIENNIQNLTSFYAKNYTYTERIRCNKKIVDYGLMQSCYELLGAWKKHFSVKITRGDFGNSTLKCCQHTG